MLGTYYSLIFVQLVAQYTFKPGYSVSLACSWSSAKYLAAEVAFKDGAGSVEVEAKLLRKTVLEQT